MAVGEVEHHMPLPFSVSSDVKLDRKSENLIYLSVCVFSTYFLSYSMNIF